jgi:hypothetical protein
VSHADRLQQKCRRHLLIDEDARTAVGIWLAMPMVWVCMCHDPKAGISNNTSSRSTTLPV